jgi:hypothetical protein
MGGTSLQRIRGQRLVRSKRTEVALNFEHDIDHDIAHERRSNAMSSGDSLDAVISTLDPCGQQAIRLPDGEPVKS